MTSVNWVDVDLEIWVGLANSELRKIATAKV